MKECKCRKLSEILNANSRVILAWIMVFLFFFLSFWSKWTVSFLHALLLTFSLFLSSYIESRYVIKLLKKGVYFLFYLINFLMIVIMASLTTYLESFMLIMMSEHLSISIPQMDGFKMFLIPLLIRIVLFTAVIAISVITVLQRTEKENQRIKDELRNEKLDMELRFLKSQITPHFLFNALNNIYSLVYINDENAPKSVLKLSEMLRYVMVDCQVDMISIEKEINYINSYIDFHMMSMENNSNVIFEKNVKNNDFKIPPMIIQPLVENSFKHSRLDNDPTGFVHFYMLQENNTLLFIARNSVKGLSVSLVNNSIKGKEGIGLNNVRKRLELHYGNNYSFDTKIEDNCYVATIKIGGKYNEEKV